MFKQNNRSQAGKSSILHRDGKVATLLALFLTLALTLSLMPAHSFAQELTGQAPGQESGAPENNSQPDEASNLLTNTGSNTSSSYPESGESTEAAETTEAVIPSEDNSSNLEMPENPEALSSINSSVNTTAQSMRPDDFFSATYRAPAAVAYNSSSVESRAGATRFETAIANAYAAYPSGATSVILAKDSDFPDALAAAALAGKLQAPILLSGTNDLPPAVSACLQQLGAQDIYLIGSPASISTQLEDSLQANYGVAHVTRIGGTDRFETARAVYNYGASHGGWPTSEIILITGEKFPDALSISPYAAFAKTPILLTRSGGELDANSQALIASILPSSTVIAGGTPSVSGATED